MATLTFTKTDQTQKHYVDAETLKRLSAPVPRYTSYPTAPHFSADVDATTYREWLTTMADDQHISLYVHIPFCVQLCWYCGCTTKVTQRYAPIRAYLDALKREIALVGSLLPPGTIVRHIHFGGGSPSILAPDDIADIDTRLRSAFSFSDDVEYAIEVDPRGLDDERIAAFATAGVNRVSIGVQDFKPEVQDAINRQQDFELTRDVITRFREHGVGSINIDLVYGLPHQTDESVADTINQVVSLKPDRIALFGYAHLPARITHQRLIPEDSLPDTGARYSQSVTAAETLIAAGYVRVGLDHFALPHDDLAGEDVRRNFQGYTSDDADTLIGLGASSIGKLPQGYVQNSPAVAHYERRLSRDGVAVVRGHAMSEDDTMRALAIEALMCGMRFPADELRARFGNNADVLIDEARSLVREDVEGFVVAGPDSDEAAFEVTEKGRPFVRSICATFDAYLASSTARHSAGV